MKRIGRRWGALLLAAAMVFSLLPMAAFAAGDDGEEAWNLAFHQPTAASSVANNAGPDLAVDGVSDQTVQWNSVDMKTSTTTENDSQTPQWLRVDLGYTGSTVEKIKLWYNAKVWPMVYEIQTTDSLNVTEQEDGTLLDESAWETVVRVVRSPHDGNVANVGEQNIANTTENSDTITATSDPRLETTTLKRYVRFYVEKLNTAATGGHNINLREIEIFGTNPNRHQPVDAAALLATATATNVTATGTEVTLPDAPNGATLTVAGSTLENVIANDGTIGGKNIEEREVQLLIRAWDNDQPSEYEQKNLAVTVPDHKSSYSEAGWFPTVTNPNPKPEVIPSIQEWYGYTGSFTLSESSRIVINDAANVGLSKAAANMQADVLEISGLELPIDTGTSGGPNDIYIESQTTDSYDLGKEGYLMRVSDEGIQIYAPTYTGCLFGTITVEQILWQAADHLSVPCGIMRDYPAYEVRGIKLDVGRAPYRYQQLQDYAKIMLWYKMSEYDLHINDTENPNGIQSATNATHKGFHRLESDTFPSLSKMSGVKLAGVNASLVDAGYYNDPEGYGGNPVYTKEQWQELTQLAKDYGMHLLTEIDMPGHAQAYNQYVEAHLQEVKDADVGVNGPVRSTNTTDYRAFELLDLTGDNAENALNFAKALWDEYTSDGTISGDVVHIGADEYWIHDEETNDAFARFADALREVIQDEDNLGPNTKIRMWGASSTSFSTARTVLKKTHAQLAEDYELEIWDTTRYDNAAQRAKDGYQIINCRDSYVYSNPGRTVRDVPNAEYLFNNWDPTEFGGTNPLPGEPNLLGAKAVVWGEQTQEGLTERDVHQRVLRAIAIMSEKTWGGLTHSEGEFSDYEMRFNRLAEGPGTEIAMNIPSETSLVLDYDFKNLSANGKTVFDQSGNGYNGALNTAGTVDTDGYLTFDGSTLLTTDLTTLSYPYTVSFDLKADAGNTKESSLFSGYDGRIQVAGHNGKLSANECSFIRDFNYEVPTNGTAVKITIVGTQQATRLYVDGQLVTFLSQTEDKDGTAPGAITSYYSSVLLPLEKIGQGFHGKMANLKVYNKAMTAAEIAGTNGGLVNVAQNAIVGGSSPNGANDNNVQRICIAAKAVDGEDFTDAQAADTKTTEMWSYWQADSGSNSLTVDLGQTRSVSQVVMHWRGSAPSTTLQTSANGTDWADYTSGSTVNARYVKVNANGAGKLQELLVYEQVDKTNLNALLALAEELVEEDGLNFETTGEGKALFDAVVFARAVKDSPLATRADVARAVSGLREFVSLPSLLPTPVPAGAEVKEDWKTDLRPANGTTQNQPFPAEGVAGGDFFRIPALVTIENGDHKGRIVAMADARWKHMGDGNNIDTLLSYSDDNGATWNYSFVNFFGDTGLAVKPTKAAIFIDPVLAQDKEGNLYLMADAFPAGHSTWGGTFERPEDTNGFAEIDGVQRMTVYTSPNNADQDNDNYSYYIGDFAPIDGSETKYAPILEAEGGFESGFYTDDHFYLYFTTRKTKDPASDKIYCAQMDGSSDPTNTWVQQNLFFYNATLHLRNAQFLYMVKSTDGGVTWSAPMILNDQVRTGAQRFYGPGPGAGIYLDDGTIVLPCYQSSSSGAEFSSFIYSKDGVNWTRTDPLTVGSSESTIVQIDDTTVRQFYRSGSSTLRYIDYTKDADGVWSPTNVEVDTGAARRAGNQLAAIRYSQKVEGKDIVMVSTSTSANGGNAWSRWHGVIHTFAVNADKTMTLLFTKDVNSEADWYGYSSLTELPDGSLGLLYESSHTDAGHARCSIRYVTIPVNRSAIALAIVAGQAAAMEQDDYYENVAGAWNTFQSKLAAANAALEKTNATTAELDAATAALKAAMANLTKVEVVLSGTVTGVSGMPVAGAVVTLENSAYYAVGLTATTDAQGQFEFRETDAVALTVADYQFKVQAAGYQVTTKPAAAITKAQPTSHTDIALESEEAGAYVNNFDTGDISMLHGATGDAVTATLTLVDDPNGGKAVKISGLVTGNTPIHVLDHNAPQIKNGTVEMDITVLGGSSNRFGLALRANGTGNRVWIGHFESNSNKWNWQSYGGSFGTFNNAGPLLMNNATRHVKVEMNETNMTLWVDGVLMGEATNMNALNVAGYIGLSSMRSSNEYIIDNICVISADAPAAGTYTVEGVVREGSVALAGATVEIYNGESLVTSTVTNATGAYKTQSLQPGTYTLQISAPGYETRRVEITVTDANLTRQNITLKADKAELIALYDANKDRDQELYTSATWGVFQTALEAAKRTIDKATATKIEVERVLNNLAAAVAGLEERVNKSALEAALAEAKAVTNDSYTAATWNAFQDAIDKAETVLANETATLAQVNEAIAALTSTRAALVKNTGGGGGTTTPPVTPPVVVVDPNGPEQSDPNAPTTETDRKKNPDGTKTTVTTVTDPVNGTVTTTMERSDGAKVEKVAKDEVGVTITVTNAQGETVAELNLPATVAGPETRFEDVPKGHWADKAIHTIAALGVVNGVGDNKFDMSGDMTRGALATVLHRLSNKPAGAEMAFEDIAEDAYYADGVAWAAKVGVVEGFSPTAFKPEQTITREQLALMLMRYAKLVGMDTTVSTSVLTAFSDGENAHSWAAGAVAWCAKNGILQGKGGGKLDPTANVTRAEVAVMIQRFLDLVK